MQTELKPHARSAYHETSRARRKAAGAAPNRERKDPMMKLSDAPEGARVRIAATAGTARFLGRVTAIGLTPGCVLDVLQNKRKRPVLVRCRDSAIAIDRGDCERIRGEEAL